jgi:tRNA 2-thiouridine synthesizing protein A
MIIGGKSMKSILIDCCGLSCPEPVLRARKAMMEFGAEEVKIKVNSTTARDNVSRAAGSLGWKVKVEFAGEEDYYLLTLVK